MGIPLVSIVLLNWNCRSFLASCIDSVLNQTYPNIEFMIIDNASTDGSVDFLRENYPELPMILNSANLGFAKAHNEGIRQTRGEYYMPLNPDVVLHPNFVEKLVEAMEEEKSKGIRVGAATGKVYFADKYGNPTNIIYTTGHVLTRNRKPHNRGYKQLDSGKYNRREFVFGANGACPLYFRWMLEDVSIEGEYFDEMFFLYGDDYDLGWRAQLFGWKCIYVPDAIAYHSGKGSGGLHTPFIQYQYLRNHYLTLLKNDFLSHFLADLPFIIIYQCLWQFYIFLVNPRRGWTHLRAFADFIRLAPHAAKKRRLIHSRKSVSPEYIRSLFVGIIFK